MFGYAQACVSTTGAVHVFGYAHAFVDHLSTNEKVDMLAKFGNFGGEALSTRPKHDFGHIPVGHGGGRNRNNVGPIANKVLGGDVDLVETLTNMGGVRSARGCVTTTSA